MWVKKQQLEQDMEQWTVSKLGKEYIKAVYAPQDEAGLTKTFQTWPRGGFHLPKDPDFPVPS